MNNRLRELRIEMGLTQRELAGKLGSTDKNIWAYEKGIAFPPYEILSAYADFFDVTTDYLIGRTNDYGVKTAAPMVNAMGESYTAEERELIKAYRELPTDSRKLVLRMVGVSSTSQGAKRKA